MDIEIAAEGFSAMGAANRLAVLRQLVKAGDEGLQVGDIATRSGMAASTLAHHLKALQSAGLITQEKHGRATLNRANYQHLEALAAYILHECCVTPAQKGENEDG